MEINNILSFKKENIFDGAVQIDWFYDQKLRSTVASSYIFHGPKYFGLTNKDIRESKHKLIDTASFIKKIAEKIYIDDSSNRFMLTIAGYGAGKSHLGVTMASLFSGNDIETKERILENISTIDNDIYMELKHTIDKPNLIITLNGMNNFNLNNEILKNVKRALQLHGQDDSVLQEISTAYITAENFIKNIYDNMSTRFVYYASKSKGYRLYKEKNLKDKLIEDIYENKEAFDIIDSVYKEVTGNNIRWDDGISANNILLKLNEYFCEKNNIFNKIVIIFDEFGRFLEYASAHPNQAGDSALQQIFEAIQNANKNILFLGFIQSDLSAYISRVESPNIKRYVGRYDTSDKYYLSSNLETVLANLIYKDDPNGIIDGYIERKYSNYHTLLHTNLNRWLKDMQNKSVWSNKNLYNNVILKGCYPFHPITVWMLSNLSTWMQQRSTLNFAGEIFDDYKHKEVYDEGLTYIYPIEIIKSKIFRELYDAEEKGLQQSQYCLMYSDIISKYGDKLSQNQIDILQGILIANICKFKVFDRSDFKTLLKYITGLYDDLIEEVLNTLEEDFGIIKFDIQSNTYDLIAEGSGKNEFKNEFIRKRNQISKEGYLDIIDDRIKKDLDLDKYIETPFGIEHNITSMEWEFEKKLIHIDDLSEFSINSLIREQQLRRDITQPKGLLVYVYTDQESYMKVNELQRLINNTEVKKYPILFMLINDSENIIKNRLIDIKTLMEFSTSQRDKYAKFIQAYYHEFMKLTINKFKSLELEKQFITDEGIIKGVGRLANICNSKFMECYKKIVPFTFDGFEKTPIGKANGYLVTICKGLISNEFKNSTEGLSNFGRDEQNRIKSVLMIESNKSWKVMNSDCMLLEPQYPVLLEMYQEVKDNLDNDKIMNIGNLFRKYLYPPYNMNYSSLALFISYFLSYNRNNISIYKKNQKIKYSIISEEVFNKSKIDFKKLLDFEIEYREGSKEEQFIQLVETITNNVYVENCLNYQLELDRLESEEEIPYTLKPKISLARIKLEKGKELYRDIYSKLEEAKDSINDNPNRPNYIFKLSKIYNNLNIFESDRLEMGYQYSDSYIKECNNYREEIKKAIDNNAKRYILSINSSVPEKFYKNEIIYKQTIKALGNIGRNDIASKLKKRYEDVEREIILIKKYEDELASFKNDISKIEESLSSKRYGYLESSVNIINKWAKFFSSNTELTDKIKEDNINKLNDLRLKVGHTLDEIDRDIRVIELDATLLEDIYSIRNLRREIKSIYNNIIDSKFESKITKMQDLLENIESEIKVLELNKLNRELVQNIIDELIEKYNNTFLSKFINKQKDNIYINLENLEKKYISEVLFTIETNIKSMDYKTCMENINKLSNLPQYTGEESKKRANFIIEKLYDRINENKIETIIGMFDELSSKNKEICMDLLKKYI